MRCGLIGETLVHSHSPWIHAQLGGYTYELFSMPPQDVPDFLKSAAYDGLNVTIPYKQTVLPYCDTRSPLVERTGSANTLIRDVEGRLHAYNTDYMGFSALAARAGISFAGRKVAILGSGGTARTVRAVAEDAHARAVVTISRQGPVLYTHTTDYADADIVVNATPVGMFPHTRQAAISLDLFTHCTGVLDAIYNPLRTALLLDAHRRGIPYADGLYMLVAQACASYALFTGKKADDAIRERIYRALRRKLITLVLVGMPGCGKTVLGRALAERLGRPCLDVDAEIERRAGHSVVDLFAHFGEEWFRAMERDVIADAMRAGGGILATGGGSVLLAENRDAMMQNGWVGYIERPLAQLDCAGRPLSRDMATLARMYAQRHPLYAGCCDAHIANDATIAEVAARIETAFEARLGAGVPTWRAAETRASFRNIR